MGVGSAFAVIGSGELLGRTGAAGWSGNVTAGSIAADPYTRAIVARNGLLALNRSETIYFHRYEDERGRTLSADCTYELSGGTLPARWWSVTIYAADNFLPVNGDDAQSIDASRIARAADGRWTARIAAQRAGVPNWISSRHAGKFSLSIRLYNPDDRARADAGSIPFPSIRTIDCGGKRP